MSKIGRLSRWYGELISLLVLPAALVALAMLFVDHDLDRSFIVYRYARNLSEGVGFAYNPGEPVLGEAVAPLYAALLAIGATLTPDLPLLGKVMGAVSIALGALALYGLTYSAEAKLRAPLAAGFYVAFPLLWITLGLETPLWVAFGLIAAWMHLRQWGVGTAVMLALATFLRPEIGALGIVLIADSLIRGRSLRLLPVGVYTGMVIAGALWGITSLEGSGGPLPALAASPPGTLLPDTIGAKALTGMIALVGAFWSLSWLWVALAGVSLAGLAVSGLPSRGSRRGVLLLVAWAVLHILTLGAFGVGVYAWSFAPLVPALAGTTALGVSELIRLIGARPLKWATGVVYGLLVMGAAWQSFAKLAPGSGQGAPHALAPVQAQEICLRAGIWLRDHTPPEARVGSTEVGVLGYASDRYLLDYRGRFHLALADAVRRGDSQWWLVSEAPDYVVLWRSEYESLGGYPLSSDLWFNVAYSQVAELEAGSPDEEPLLIFQRVMAPPQMEPILVSMVTYPGGLQVNGIATDFPLDPFEGGRLGMVGLEWYVPEPVLGEQHVMIRIQNRDGTIAALADRVFDFSNWPHRELHTTYHPLELAPTLTPGIYEVAVGIGPDPLTPNWQTITHAKVPFPDVAFVGAVSGTRAEFGDIALVGYRLTRSNEGLEVLLMWEAIQAPRTDYRIFVQIRGLQGEIVTQIEAEPHGGNYPASFWSVGERITETYLIDVRDVPAGDYQVYVGVIDLEGTRLLTLDGRDAVLIGQVNLAGAVSAP